MVIFSWYIFRHFYIYETTIKRNYLKNVKMDLLEQLKVSLLNFNFVMIYIIHKILLLLKATWITLNILFSNCYLNIYIYIYIYNIYICIYIYNIYVYIYIYITCIYMIFWKLAWVRFEPTTIEFRSDAVIDWAIRPWVIYICIYTIYILLYIYHWNVKYFDKYMF